jgi:hypothetical protein
MSGAQAETPIATIIETTDEIADMCYLSAMPCPFGGCIACMWAPKFWSTYMQSYVLPRARHLVRKQGKVAALKVSRNIRTPLVDKGALIQALESGWRQV